MGGKKTDYSPPPKHKKILFLFMMDGFIYYSKNKKTLLGRFRDVCLASKKACT